MMSSTLVIQSHRDPLPFNWLQPCLASVRRWARERGFDYRFLGDELFDVLDPELLHKTAGQTVIATDLARLAVIRAAINEGYDCVVWLDADFLVFDAAAFDLPDDDYALGREVWVQSDDRGDLRCYVKVHNAALLFRRGNVFLDFYHATAERLLRLNTGSMPPQFIGPKLLSALHNIAQCPVFDKAGMLSPLVMSDLLHHGGSALRLFRQKSDVLPVAANLCSSLTAGAGLNEDEMQRLIEILLAGGLAEA